MIDKSKITGRCPFCGGEVKEHIGFGGILFFLCQNKECGAIMSFNIPSCNASFKAARINFNRRAIVKNKEE